jgi:predicted Zn-dependent protease
MALLLAISQAQAPAQQSYVMDGKPVSRAFYELFNESIQLLRANRNEEASGKLKQAVALAPDHAEAHYNYGLALAKTGHMSEALEQLQAGVAINPAMEGGWLSMAAIYQANGRVDDAIKAYQQYLRRFPTSADAPKISSLLKGLQEIAASQSSSSPSPPVQNDYLADVTRDGIARWPLSKMPLKVYLQSGQNVQGFQPSFEETLKKSFVDWSAASGGIITFKSVAASDDADIICSWTSDNARFANASELGEAHVTTSAGQIVSAKLELLTVSALPGVQMSEKMIRSTTLHEIGHALGLSGHTTNPGDIMFYDSATINDQWRNLSARDTSTIVKLYSAK